MSTTDTGPPSAYTVVRDVGELQIGDYVTVWRPNETGQGGTIEALHLDVAEPYRADLVSGTARHQRAVEITGPNVRRIERHEFLAATDCTGYDPDECRGPVDWRSAPSGSAVERCVFHQQKRWEQYERSDLERYADSDSAPAWFDPADAGERWDDDY